MRELFIGSLICLAVVLTTGCDRASDVKDSLAERASPAPTATPESTVETDTSEPQGPDRQTVSDHSTASPDVREVGPADVDSTPAKPDDEAFGGPLKDMPLPTAEEPQAEYVETQTIEIPNNWTRVTKEGQSEVWIDVKAKHVIVAGRTCLQQGGLEMFICPFFTKEHESVIAVNARSFEIHSSLLAIGAAPGSPVQWDPEYQPARGPIVKIDVMWKDPAGGEIITRRGQEMIRDFKTKKPMELDWVFGGSVLEKDPETGQSYYYADGGELVCLSNFSTAALDVPIQSSDSNEDLLYEANPDMIPEPGTKVYVIFKPEINPASDQEKPPATDN